MNAPAAAPPAATVVIPVFNEAQTVGGLVDAVLELAETHQWEVIVVDDGSTDGVRDVLDSRSQNGQLTLLSHPYNRGYGAALKTGVKAAAAPVVATMDGDGQHDPNDLVRLLPLASQYDLVVGRRTGRIHSQLWRMPGKWMLGALANFLSGHKIPDLNSGMRIFRAETMRRYLHLCPNGFSFSTTSTMVFFDRGYSVRYEPIDVRKRPDGNKSTVSVKTGFDTLLLVVRLASLFQPLKVFLPLSALFILAGLGWGLPYLIISRGISVGSLLLLLTGILMFFFGLLTDQVAQLRMEKYE